MAVLRPKNSRQTVVIMKTDATEGEHSPPTFSADGECGLGRAYFALRSRSIDGTVRIMIDRSPARLRVRT